MTRFAFIAFAALAICLSRVSFAQQLDLSTLPPRDTVQLTIYNGEDLTLVRETRRVTVRAGMNSLQFSWANTLIDPTSVSLRFGADGKDLELVDTRYPHDRPQALYWNVRSPRDGDATAEITYFTSGISWSADYVGVSDASESSMAFEGFVTVTNGSGEDYADAQVRLVVGSINIVEKIRELAERGAAPVDLADKLMERSRDELGIDDRKLYFSVARGAIGGELEQRAPKEIVKEGLSEYFIFTVPGTETVRNGWSKRMRLFEGTKVPVRIEYRYRPEEYGDRLARLYLVRNDEASTLGESPLPDGAVKLYRRRGAGEGGGDGLSVVGFVQTKYVPIGQEFEFDLGSDPQVTLERVSLRSWRDDFWFRRGDEVRLFSPSKGDRIEPSWTVSGWTEHESRAERVRNERGDAVEVSFRIPFSGDATFRSGLGARNHDYRTVEFSSRVDGHAERDLAYEAEWRQGTNAKQQSVTVEPSS